MKISFTTMATPGLPIPAQFEAARAYGFDGVDLRMIERGNGEVPKDLTQQEADAIREAAHHIETPVLLCYNEKIQSGNDTMAASLLTHMELAAKLQIPAIRIFTGKLESEKDQAALVDVLKSVLQEDRTGIMLAMQNHINSSITLHQALEVCQSVADPRLSVILSPDHAVLIGEELMPILPGLTQHISQLYVADMDEYHKSVLPGHGKLPYPQILRSLRENGFDGYITLKWEKCWHPELPSHETAFAAFLPWVQKLRSSL